MSKFFYSRLAAENIRKHAQTYIPYILTCIGSVMMFHILDSLKSNPELNRLPGGGNLRMILGLGSIIIAIFSSIFLVYTNSFLIKRRKKEIGLLNILGMEKKHIGRILFFETVFTGLLSIGIGIGGGFLLSKIVYLGLLMLLQTEIQWGFHFSIMSAARSAFVFGGIFLFILLINLVQVQLCSPVELLKGNETGEREPKTRWGLASVGVVTLVSGYYLASASKNPILVIFLFFVAVILVIIGTYCLFTAGSIALLKCLKRNKQYYYQTKHFISISGMIYRMKQNAAGLAGICILSTAVLVMVSSTVSLYAGMDDVMKARFPRSCMVNFYDISEEGMETVEEILDRQLLLEGLERKEPISYRSLSFTGFWNGDGSFQVENLNAANQFGELKYLFFVPLEDYNKITGSGKQLKKNQVIVLQDEGEYDFNTLKIFDKSYEVVSADGQRIWNGADRMGAMEPYYIIMPDILAVEEVLEWQKRLNGDEFRLVYYTSFNVDADKEGQMRLYNGIRGELSSTSYPVYLDFEAMIRDEYFSVNAGLLFLGIFLGLLFTMATVLIIYYKQVTEGYDDKGKFEIMQKVGLSKKEIKASVRFQILLMFSIPLATAGIHIVFAFPMITRMLAVMNLTNIPLFTGCAVGTYLVFAAIYGIVYGMTSKVYIKIVS